MQTRIVIFLLLLSACGVQNTSAQDVPLSYDVENTGADCTEPPLPSVNELPSIEALPDPFAWADTTHGRISNFSDWRCRRAEIRTEVQHYELGPKPDPPEDLSTTLSDDTLTVTVEENGNSLSLMAPVTIPEGDGPFPVVIGVGFTGTGSLPSDIFTDRDVATVQYNLQQIAPPGFEDVERGQGGFYELYPDSKAGFFSAWAWGVSRLIDGLEQASELNLNHSRLAITGCSFAGKISLFSSGLDERITLTIAQEPGGGGDAAWRVTETLEGKRETLSRAQGAPWYRENLSRFNDAVTKLPFDHHEVMGMVAPRALLVLGNPSHEWLAEESGHVASKAAETIWAALGVPERFGFSKVGEHKHCQLPESQRPEVAAFVDKFLLGKDGPKTDIERSPYDPNLSRWIPWETPKLE